MASWLGQPRSEDNLLAFAEAVLRLEQPLFFRLQWLEMHVNLNKLKKVMAKRNQQNGFHELEFWMYVCF